MTRARIVLFLVLTLAVACLSTLTLAQPRRPTRGHPAPKKPKADAAPPANDAPDASVDPMTAKPETAPEGTRTHDAGAPAAHLDKDTVETRTLDGGAKVFRFGEVEIEGRLRSPQLVYFLRRVRAEFAAGDLGHRSFVREMSDTRSDPSF